MTDIQTLTFFHTAISLVALLTGFIAIRGLFAPQHPVWHTLFLLTAVITTVTGFVFPITVITPALITGAITTVLLVLTFIARSRGCPKLYSAGIVSNTYFLLFVTIVQVFLKIPAAQALAPTQESPVFAAVQGAALVLMIVLGVKAWRSTPAQ